MTARLKSGVKASGGGSTRAAARGTAPRPAPAGESLDQKASRILKDVRDRNADLSVRVKALLERTASI